MCELLLPVIKGLRNDYMDRLFIFRDLYIRYYTHIRQQTWHPARMQKTLTEKIAYSSRYSHQDNVEDGNEMKDNHHSLPSKKKSTSIQNFAGR